MEDSIDDLTEALDSLQLLLPARCSLVSATLGKQPEWFQNMANGTAISKLEDTHGVVVADSIRLFYRFPAYAVFLKVHGQLNVFQDDWNGDIPSAPTWTETAYPPWLAIAEEPISGTFLMVRLDCQCPEMSSRYFHTDEDAYTFPRSFDDWLLAGARETLQKLGNTEGCFACEECSEPR